MVDVNNSVPEYILELPNRGSGAAKHEGAFWSLGIAKLRLLLPSSSVELAAIPETGSARNCPPKQANTYHIVHRRLSLDALLEHAVASNETHSPPALCLGQQCDDGNRFFLRYAKIGVVRPRCHLPSLIRDRNSLIAIKRQYFYAK